MIELRSFLALGSEERCWLRATHHISFDPNFATGLGNFGALRAWDDDEIAPHCGFPPHVHSNMEIITYVREGAITHQDSLGNAARTQAGDVQVMSAGTGIRHAEYNLESKPTRLFQIWISSERFGGAPTWGTKAFPKLDREGRFVALASGFAEDSGALPIRASARVVGATLRKGSRLEYHFTSGRLGYLVSAAGRVNVNGIVLNPRDGAAIADLEDISLEAVTTAEILLADVPA